MYPFAIAAADRDALLRGLDDIGMTLEHTGEIEAWEAHTRTDTPWAQQLAR